MPKEVVFGQQYVPAGPDGFEVTALVPIVEVRWNREAGYVQIVSKATDPHDGRVVGDLGEAVVTDGYHVDLDRGMINKLIRDLRRARDQAFGRDE